MSDMTPEMATYIGLMAAQVVLATDCSLDAAVNAVEGHAAPLRGRLTVTPSDIASIVLVSVAECHG